MMDYERIREALSKGQVSVPASTTGFTGLSTGAARTVASKVKPINGTSWATG